MSIPDADYVYEALLRFNYFPMVKFHRDEVPPIFTTEALRPRSADQLVGNSSNRGGDGYDLINYRSTRFNNVTRLLQIPVPRPYVELCQTIRDNWANLQFTSENTISRIRPEDHRNRLFVMDGYEWPERLVVMEKSKVLVEASRRFDLTRGAKYLVEADVSNCFPSIYSHAIPWALVGHDTAKLRRRRTEWFNQLDAAVRHIKRNETNGIPIGPGTSHVVSEIILAKVDEVLSAKGYRFQRFIDDYNCYTSTKEEAEQFLIDLELELDRFMLRLNAKKVSILSLPLPMKSPWTIELANSLQGDGDLTGSDVATIFDQAILLGKEYPEGSVLKYVARMLRSRLTEDNAAVFIEYVLNLAFHFPIVLPLAFEALKEYRYEVPPLQLEEILAEHLKYRRSDGICWTLVLMYLSKNEDSVKKYVPEVVDSQDCLGMACLLNVPEGFDAVKVFVRGLGKARPGYLLDQYWILILEVAHRDPGVKSHFADYLDKSGLGYLIDQNIHFVNFDEIPDSVHLVVAKRIDED